MGEFEERLNSILSSPKDMEKILGLARQLSGAGDAGDKAEPPPPEEERRGTMNDLDPRLLKLASRLMAEYSGGGNDKTALIAAIRPYVRQERREALDKAARITKLTHLARLAMTELGGDLHFDL